MDQVCEVVIDQAGNIKLPDELLLEAGLRPGSKIIVQREAHGELRLRAQPASSEVSEIAAPIELVEEEGHLFLRGVKPFDVDNVIEEERAARLRESLTATVIVP